MSELIIEFLKEINIAQLIAIAGMFWFFYTRLNNKISDAKIELRSETASLKSELKNDMASLKSELKNDIDKLSNKVEDIDRRLCRIEGSLATQGHCLYSYKNQPEKAAE